MKTVVCVVVFNRHENIKKWIQIWNNIKPQNAELRIIQNLHLNNDDGRIRDIVTNSGNTYIPRNDVGMDIGAFQDVCTWKLHGFKYDFDYIIWATDDIFPMRISFIDEFINHLRNESIGMTCYEISNQIKPHVRTTGFCVRIDTLRSISFEGKITTKNDCYRFEHLSNDNLYMQMLRTKKQVLQISPVSVSPLWDSGGGGVQWTDRQREFYDYWKIDYPPAKVIIISPAHVRYPIIVSSMINQTYKNWELHLVHSGRAPADYPRFNDPRIKFYEVADRKNYGHPTRVEWLNKIRSGEIQGDYVLVTNDDNFHVPHFLEKLIKPLEINKMLVGSYCSAMVHNYKGDGTEIFDPEIGHVIDGYGVMDIKPERGYIDCACAVVRAKQAADAGWPSTAHSSDWDYLNIIAQRSGGWNKFKLVFGTLLTHN